MKEEEQVAPRSVRSVDKTEKYSSSSLRYSAKDIFLQTFTDFHVSVSLPLSIFASPSHQLIRYMLCHTAACVGQLRERKEKNVSRKGTHELAANSFSLR
jgi:hypothetical protein